MSDSAHAASDALPDCSRWLNIVLRAANLVALSSRTETDLVQWLEQGVLCRRRNTAGSLDAAPSADPIVAGRGDACVPPAAVGNGPDTKGGAHEGDRGH